MTVTVPDKRKVVVGFRSQQQGGELTESVMTGELLRLTSGWAVTCQEPPRQGEEIATTLTLFIHKEEIRLRRRGGVSMELQFRKGAVLPGTYETPHGPLTVEVHTGRLDIHVGDAGGTVEWEYELTLQEQEVGLFEIRLDIREENSV
jgi:uncharacterized beta-barrel protein YwiB (DUF1934 family)